MEDFLENIKTIVKDSQIYCHEQKYQLAYETKSPLSPEQNKRLKLFSELGSKLGNILTQDLGIPELPYSTYEKSRRG